MSNIRDPRFAASLANLRQVLKEYAAQHGINLDPKPIKVREPKWTWDDRGWFGGTIEVRSAIPSIKT